MSGRWQTGGRPCRAMHWLRIDRYFASDTARQDKGELPEDPRWYMNR